MYKKLDEILKNLKGNVLTIGLDDKLISSFDKNNKVNLYAIKSNKTPNSFIRSSKKKNTNQGKKINIKKLKKYINKKSVDYLICNVNEIMDYYKYIIKDTILLNNNKIYLYFNKDIDKNFIVNKYKRYNVKINTTEYKNGYLIEIDNKNGKNNFIKDKFYFIKDTIYNVAEMIGNILIN